MSPAILGFVRGLGLVAIIAILSYAGDITNLGFLANPWLETLVASIAMSIEQSIEAKTGRVLLGTVKGIK